MGEKSMVGERSQVGGKNVVGNGINEGHWASLPPSKNKKQALNLA
ncbi:hypothetical protein [Enterovibrio baiacu]|nr:hypothetical protein [Enterovibrio baiacu]